jgi:putative addiction module killer protein
MPFVLVHYQSPTGVLPFKEWLKDLADPRAKGAIQKRLDRLALGNFGDHRHCRGGVWELRLDVGPGYRIYLGRGRDQLVVLPGGGDKSTQTTDIERAVACWLDHRRRFP